MPCVAVKTTLYLPEDLKRDVERVARQRGVSEAELTRESLRGTVAESDRRGSAARDVLRSLASDSFELPGIGGAGLAAALELGERYADRGLGVPDASLVVLADRYGTRDLLTLDERHFRAVEPLQGGRFRLLPSDA